MEDKEYFFTEALKHLQNLISIPSFSNEEDRVADLWQQWLKDHGSKTVKRFHNNVYALSENYDKTKPTLLLNSHLDTVKPVNSYTRDPFDAEIKDDKLFGLGSNDAGGAGVSLATTFLKLKDRKDLPFNLMFAITASEERMGEYGMRAFLPHLKEEGIYPSMAIVGEPTECMAAIAERGLVVCDVEVEGKAGHAARKEGVNAIYRAIEDIEDIEKLNNNWPKTSETLGDIKATVTIIGAGTQHNVVPDKCTYVVDIRTTDAYTNEETVELLRENTKWSKFTPRSTRIRASVLSHHHPLFMAAELSKMPTFVSPTTSDMALMHDIPSIKIGPGKSERSHSADEFIYLEEIRQGCLAYEDFINTLSKIMAASAKVTAIPENNKQLILT